MLTRLETPASAPGAISFDRFAAGIGHAVRHVPRTTARKIELLVLGAFNFRDGDDADDRTDYPLDRSI